MNTPLRNFKINLNLPKLLYIYLVVYFIILLVNINAIYFLIGDESVYQASVNALLSGIINANNHPLLAKTIWAVFAYFSSVVLGHSAPLFWRIGTVFFSIATLIIFYKLSKLFFNHTVSIIAVVILSIDPMYFVFSRLLQLDIIALFFSLGSLYLLLRYAKNPRSKLIYFSGLFMGLSLSAKLSALPSSLLVPILIFLIQKSRNLQLSIKHSLGYLTVLILGFAAGNIIFFTFKTKVSFLTYTKELILSQLNNTQISGQFMTSPAWSWFTIPQILPLYRIDYGSFVSTVKILQNPLIFVFSLPSVLILLIYILTKKPRNLRITIIILFLFSGYLPWFLNLHSSYYYYIIPLLPLTILIFFTLIKFHKMHLRIYYLITLISVIIFILYYPLLTGIKVSKYYESTLSKYSLYNYPKKNTLLCQHCSPLR